MTQPSAQPHLTPQFCFSTVALRDFLRISRSAIDDSISQNLNALLTPSSQPFDPTSTSSRPLAPHSRKIPSQACDTFKSQILFPSWRARTEVIQYCASVAMSPDPDDPDVVARQLEGERDKQRVIDDRLDPYSSRFFPTESRAQRLAAVIRQEQGVERIVRERTWSVVQDRCEDSVSKSWEEALREWESGGKGR